MTSFKPPRHQRRSWIGRPRPATLRKRAESLLLGHRFEAWERLDGELRLLNFTACSGRHRLRCLEPLFRCARRLQVALEEQLVGERYPPPPAIDELLLRARHCWTRLAVGYLCVQRDLGEHDRGARADGALRGLQSMAQLMLDCYHQYTPEPRGAWRAVHELHDGLGPKPGSATFNPAEDGDAADPGSAYKQILVMAGTGPFRFRPDEQALVHRVLAGWVRHVTIRSLRGAEPKAPPVVFRPGEDEAPRQYPLDQVPDAPGLRLIDPAPLAGRARRRLEQIETGDSRPGVSGEYLAGETLRVMLSGWSTAVSRQFPRSDMGQDTRLAIGLGPTWRALRGPPEPPLRCQVANRSAAGFQALVRNPSPGMLQVGELVAASDGSQWIAGIVRWLRRPESALLQVGVETIARGPQAVRVRGRDSDSQSSPALLLQGNRAAHHPSSLVTGPLPLREHMHVMLDDSPEMVVLGRLVESTGSINRFRIESDVPPA